MKLQHAQLCACHRQWAWHCSERTHDVLSMEHLYTSCVFRLQLLQAAAQHRQAVKDRKKKNQEKSAVVQKVRQHTLLDFERGCWDEACLHLGATVQLCQCIAANTA
jgi:hypothetical protein